MDPGFWIQFSHMIVMWFLCLQECVLLRKLLIRFKAVFYFATTWAFRFIVIEALSCAHLPSCWLPLGTAVILLLLIFNSNFNFIYLFLLPGIALEQND